MIAFDIISVEDILNISRNIWGADDFYASRSLDVFVSKLRKYLKKDESVQIVTVRGEGLKLTL